MNFAVFASGHGGNLQAIMDAIKKKKIKAHLKVVFSDKKDAYALVRAQMAKVPSFYLNPKDFTSRQEFDRAIVQEIKKYNIDFIVLAGYMRLLSQEFIRHYEGKILNIHPSLLPAFKGAYAINDAFAYGAKVTGVTVHMVVEEMDAGKVIAQEAVKITPKDTRQTLEAKIHKVEHKLYPTVIDLFARGAVHPR